MKICLVTGASRGIGAAVAQRLAGPEYTVYLNHRDSAVQARAVCDSIRQTGFAAEVCQADIVDRAAVRRMMQGIRERHGRLDILVHNAAPPLVPRSVMKLAWGQDVVPQIEVACLGFLNCVQEGADLLARPSTIIVILTDALFHKPMVQMGSYLIAKGALWGLVRAVAKEFQRKGVSVNVVSPGMTQSDLLRHYDERAIELLGQEHPLARIAQPEEIAIAVALLAQSTTAYVHGANLILNGGSDF